MHELQMMQIFTAGPIPLFEGKHTKNPAYQRGHLEATPGFEPGIRVLQTRALPLGYSALYGAGNENRTRD